MVRSLARELRYNAVVPGITVGFLADAFAALVLLSGFPDVTSASPTEPGQDDHIVQVAGLLSSPAGIARNAALPARSPARSPSLPSSPPLGWPAPAPPLTEPVVHDPAASAPITAASVVQHYVDVGRKIRVFAQARGAEAASRLWERFRYIRISDALLDPGKRDETDARLRRIEDSIAAECSH
jgi:hypothetical protein